MGVGGPGGSLGGLDVRLTQRTSTWMNGVAVKMRKAKAEAGGEGESRSSVLKQETV